MQNRPWLRRYGGPLIVGVIVLIPLALSLFVRLVFSVPGGSEDLAALKREPVARFRVEGTRLQNRAGRPAQKDFFLMAQPTTYWMSFELEDGADPYAVVEAYRSEAVRTGWSQTGSWSGDGFQPYSISFMKAVGPARARLVVEIRWEDDQQFDPLELAVDMEAVRER